jgi:phage terminase large subunit-like protein
MLDSFMNVLSGEEFDERPVDVHEFVYGVDYLNLEKLSDYQMEMVEAMTQIYRLETLISLYGEERGRERYSHTFRECILQLGKGSGKDFVSTVAVAYIVYLLLCLKDPAKYYHKPAGNAIDILNIAINAQQAKNVFFADFVVRIKTCKWFIGKFDPKADSIFFDKNIRVHSGHSERESWEGYNTLVVILDEISGFAIENTSGHAQAKTGEDIYKMYRASVTSRFPDFGKILLLSFPRFKNDFIQQRYNAAVGHKTVIMRTETVQINPDLPFDHPGNTIEITWEEDHIHEYRAPRTWALRRPSWEVNPARKIEDYAADFLEDMVDALSRFACMPPDAVDAFFKSREKIELAFKDPIWNISESGVWRPEFKADPEKEYFIHVDLAQKIDKCAVALAHVEEWVEIKIAKSSSYQPKIVVDAIRWWTPTSSHNVKFEDVREFIVELYRQGFNIKLVTFDRWNSVDIMEELRGYGIETDTLSVARPHYQDMAVVLSEERLEGPNNTILIDELLQLRAIGTNKVDHPRKGSKDLSDAVCGAIYNADKHTARDFSNRVIEKIHTYSSMKDDRKEREAAMKDARAGKVIKPPKTGTDAVMPEGLASYLDRMRVVE